MAFLQCNYFSDTLGMSVSMNVFLPESVSRQVGMTSMAPRKSFPCLYLLHGLSDDHTIWQRRTSVERYAASLGFAIVMPCVHRSFYADMVSGYRYWTFISEEVPRCARTFFHLSDRREHNFVAGLSMGGYGAFKLALSFPDRYAGAASLSGAVDIAARMSDPDCPRIEDFDLIFGRGVDIRGTEHDLFAKAEQVAELPPEARPKLFLCCGTEDYLYSQNLRFRDHAVSLGLDLEYEEGPGSHEWGYWDQQIQRVLAWMAFLVKKKELGE